MKENMSAAKRAELAIQDIEKDVESGEIQGNSLSEKFDALGQEIIADSYDILMRAKKKGMRVGEDEEYMQVMKVKQFNIISSVFAKLVRQNRVIGQPNANFDKQLIQKIKEKRSSVGEIVRTTQKAND